MIKYEVSILGKEVVMNLTTFDFNTLYLFDCFKVEKKNLTRNLQVLNERLNTFITSFLLFSSSEYHTDLGAER